MANTVLPEWIVYLTAPKQRGLRPSVDFIPQKNPAGLFDRPEAKGIKTLEPAGDAVARLRLFDRPEAKGIKTTIPSR